MASLISSSAVAEASLPEVSSTSSIGDADSPTSPSSSSPFPKSPVVDKNGIPVPTKNELNASTTAISSSSIEQDIVFKPNDADVLCGRGRAIRLHPGNQVYNRLLREGYEEYSNAKKGTKLDIVRRIVVEIRDERGGRFLERLVGGGTYYIDIGNERAMNKTAQAFRDMRVAETNGTSGMIGGGSPPSEEITDDRNADDGGPSLANSSINGMANGPVSSNSSSLAKKGTSSSSAVRKPTAVKNNASPTLSRRPLLHNNGVQSRGSALLAAAAAKAKASTNGGTLPGQPRRLSFSERVKLLHQQRTQEGSDDEDDDNDEDEDSKSGSENDFEESGGEVSETETEDSFPTYRGKNDDE
jgi:hypothetical protein